MRRILPLAFALAFACASFTPGIAPAADDGELKVTPTEGTELDPKDDKEVRKVLVDYLDALKKKDYDKAGSYIDRASLLSNVDPIVNAVAGDSTSAVVVRRRIFTVGTRDSVLAMTNGQIFEHLMNYIVSLNPNANLLLEKADLKVLATRKIADRVHVAYQLTLPPEKEGGMPYTQVTAQRLKKVDGKWRILFLLEGS